MYKNLNYIIDYLNYKIANGKMKREDYKRVYIVNCIIEENAESYSKIYPHIVKRASVIWDLIDPIDWLYIDPK